VDLADLEVPEDLEVPADLEVLVDLEVPEDLADLEAPADLEVPAAPDDIRAAINSRVDAFGRCLLLVPCPCDFTTSNDCE
jgi:hypothetical protein